MPNKMPNRRWFILHKKDNPSPHDDSPTIDLVASYWHHEVSPGSSVGHEKISNAVREFGQNILVVDEILVKFDVEARVLT